MGLGSLGFFGFRVFWGLGDRVFGVFGFRDFGVHRWFLGGLSAVLKGLSAVFWGLQGLIGVLGVLVFLCLRGFRCLGCRAGV